jgi:T5SS/PEP-CTERM-associated repeat protein
MNKCPLWLATARHSRLYPFAAANWGLQTDWACRLVLLGSLLLATPPAWAILRLDEPFSYSDGPLVDVAPGNWSTFSGTSGQVDVVSGKLILTESQPAEEVFTYASAPFWSSTNLYISFTLICSNAPSGNGACFAQLRDTSGFAYARLFVTTNGMGGPFFRLGLANTGTAPTVYTSPLQLGTTNRLILRYNAGTAQATLWVNPVHMYWQFYNGLTATGLPFPHNVQTFNLSQGLSGGDGVGTLAIEDLRIAYSFVEAFADWDNRWTSFYAGKWETYTNWSLDQPPLSYQKGQLIATNGTKSILVDPYTATNAWWAMTVSNVTLSSSSLVFSNTLFLSQVPSNAPLQIFNDLTLGKGAALVLSDSTLSLLGVRTNYSPGSLFSVDGPASFNNSTLLASNVYLWLGTSPSSTNGSLTLNQSRVYARSVAVGLANESSGSLTVNGGELVMSDPWGRGFSIGGTSDYTTNPPTAAGTFTLNDGLVSLTNGWVIVGAAGDGKAVINGGTLKAGILTVGRTGHGDLLVQGGSVEPVYNVEIGVNSNATGTVVVNGGQLIATNGGIFVGKNGDGTLLIGSNGTVVTRFLYVATNGMSGFYGQGHVEVDEGGTLQVQTFLTLGGNTQTGSVVVANSTLIVTNGATTVGDGGVANLTISNSTLHTADLLIATNSGAVGTLNLAGGTLLARSNFFVGASLGATGVVNVTLGTLTATNWPMQIGPFGSGQMNLYGGLTTVGQLMLGGSTLGAEGVLRMRGGRLKVLSRLSVNAFDGGGGDLDGSGGMVIIGEAHNASMTISSGTATNIGTLYVGYSGGYTGTFTQSGGMVTVLTNVVVGDSLSGALGNVILDGGAFYAANPAQTATLNVRNGTVVVNPGALLFVDKLVITNAAGHFLKNGFGFYATSTVLDPNMDADGDGLPNGWEQAHGLDPLSALGDDGALGDPDHDGQSNLAECRTGTDPRSDASVFRLLSATISGQNVRLDWTVVGGRSYVVQIATNGTGGITNRFADLSGLISVGGTGEGTTNYVHVSSATNRGAYYRVRLGP